MGGGVEFSFASVINEGIKFMMLMSIFVFVPLKKHECDKLFRIIFILTFAASILYLIQCFTGQAILPMSKFQEEEGGVEAIGGVYRFLFTPAFMTVLIPISIFCKKLVPKQLRYISPIVFLSGRFCTLYRTAIATSLLCILLVMFFKGSFTKMFKAAAVLLVIYLVFGNAFSERLAKGNNSTANDISALMRGDFNQARSDVSNGLTLMYRIGWVIERGAYLITSPVELLMGLPMTSDAKFWHRNYDFRFGLRDKETGYIDQANTPDISYGMMMTRYGLIGTFFLLRMCYMMMKRLYMHRGDNELALALFCLLLSGFVGAIAGTSLSDPYAWTNTYFLYIYVMKMIEYDRERIKYSRL